MRVLVIHAHPVPASYNAALCRAVVDALAEGGHEVDLCDLNAEGFEAVLSRGEREAYHAVPANRASVSAHADRLLRADGLILVFPTWWYGMPAILKGYFDRVWLPGVAFDIDPVTGIIEPKLATIRLFGVVTTAGAPWWFTVLYMGNPLRRVIMRGLARLLPKRGVERFWLVHYDIDRSTPQSRGAFLERVKRRIARIR